MRWIMLLVLSLMVLSLTGCKEEGAAEKAGKKIDDAFSVVKDKFEDIQK